jgi:undecaprenyl-phosphate galactose phosphotransferase/putative colanic acid biosynthesis UDP-glucose lipid carrier transferase
LQSAIRSGAVRGRRALILGEQSQLESMSTTDLLNDFGSEEVGSVILSGESELTADDRREIATVADRARLFEAEEIIVAVRWSNTAQLILIRESLQASPLPARLLPDYFISSLSSGGSKDFGSVAPVELQRAPLGEFEQFAKRAVDLGLATCALIILSPVMLMTAAAIKIFDHGPVIFRQRRNGFNGESFFILKFRTMTVQEDGAKITQTCKFDRRVTRLGRVLRRCSIDELPQLFNVLKGEMSLVGPRPHALAHNTRYNDQIRKYAFRHHVKPGITGWAQVNGFRGETPRLEDMIQRVELDLWYIKNWSLWLDVRILLQTCFKLYSPSAY